MNNANAINRWLEPSAQRPEKTPDGERAFELVGLIAENDGKIRERERLAAQNHTDMDSRDAALSKLREERQRLSDELDSLIGRGAGSGISAQKKVDGDGSTPRKKRRDLLTPAIEAAQKACGNPFDAPAVWDEMVKLARQQKHSLLGVSDEGIKWVDSNDETRFFKLGNLRDRLMRSKKGSDKAR
jgi:hypothetical protein